MFAFLSVFALVFSYNPALSREDPWWTTYPGFMHKFLFKSDTGFVAIGNTFSQNWNIYTLNQAHFNYFDHSGNHLGEWKFGLDTDTVIFGFDGIRSLNSITRLKSNHYLAGAHYNQPDSLVDKLQTMENYQEKNRFLPCNKNDSLVTRWAYSMIVRLNDQLDSIVDMHVMTNRAPYFARVEVIHEKHPDTLVLVRKETYPSTMRIMETDSLFNVRWDIRFGYFPQHHSNIRDFIQTPSGNYLLLVEYNEVLPFFKTEPLRLFKFSKEGELLWERDYPMEDNMPYGGSLQVLDNGNILMILCDFAKPNPPNYGSVIHHDDTTLWLKVLDQDGNILTSRNMNGIFRYVDFTLGFLEGPEDKPYFHAYFPRSTNITSNGNILISGAHHWDHWRGFMLKVDQDLNPAWIRVYEIDKDHYHDNHYIRHEFVPNAPVETEDGFALSGRFIVFYSLENNEVYPPDHIGYYFSGALLKTDPYGCLEPGCEIYDHVPEWDMPGLISLYPNPANTWVNLTIDLPSAAHKEKVLYISDLGGKEVLSRIFTGNELKVSLAGIRPGTYLAYVISEGLILKSGKLVVVQ